MYNLPFESYRMSAEQDVLKYFRKTYLKLNELLVFILEVFGSIEGDCED
jgi:hypothetical protein